MRFYLRSFTVLLIIFTLVTTFCSRHDDKEDPAPHPVAKPDTAHSSQQNNPPSKPVTPTQEFLEFKVLPQETDSAMAASPEPHYAYLDKRKSSNGLLLVFLAGTNSFPKHYLMFSQAAAALGYHVINVNYPNSNSGRAFCNEKNGDCFGAYHEEMIFGKDVSDAVQINETNSIENRIVRLLQFLDHKYPADGWDQFFSGDTPLYSKCVVAGHSQGGGHAAYIAYKVKVNRAIVFNAPYDFHEIKNETADWCRSTLATPINAFYSLMHDRDEIVPPLDQYEVWKDLKLLQQTDTISADRTGFEKSHTLYTDIDPNPNAEMRLKHNAAIRDDAIPSDATGEQIKKVWTYFITQ